MVDLTLEPFLTIPPRPLSSGTKKTHKLTPLEKKERDRLRKKEQAKSRVQAIKDQENQAKLLQESKLKSVQWHRQECSEEEQLLKRFERDTIDPQKQNPATAGYEFRKSTTGKIQESLPVFWGHSMAILPISQVRKVSKSLVDVKKIPTGAQATHPASFGYTMARSNDASVISPIFFYADFNKIPLSKVVSSGSNQKDTNSLLDDMHATGLAVEGIEDFESEEAILERTGLDKKTFLYQQQKRLEEIMEARFKSPNECLVCQSSQALGCPGCFMYNPKKQQYISDERAKTPKTPSLEQQQQLYQQKQQALQQSLLTASTDGAATLSKPQPFKTVAQVQEEADYYANLLTDFHMIRKHRLICKNYVQLGIKSVPAGSMVSIQVDSKSTIQYLYEVYRSNFDEPNRKIHLLLPTSMGIFYLDDHIERATDTLNPIVKGFLTLEDYNLPARKNQQLMLFSVAILHDTSTSSMLSYYIHHNFHLPAADSEESEIVSDKKQSKVDHTKKTLPKISQTLDTTGNGHQKTFLDLCIKYVPNQVPLDVVKDYLQQRLASQVRHLLRFANENRIANMEFLRQARQHALQIARQEKMALLLEAKKGNKRKLRSSKEIRALAFYHFAMDELTLIPRLTRLWQCFQLFEELKLTKNGRLIQAEQNDHTTNLLSMHRDATVKAFDQILQKKPGPLLFGIVAIVGGGSAHNASKNTSGFKFALKIGTRLGTSVKENRGYGLFLDLDQDFDAEALAAFANSTNNKNNSKWGRRRGDVAVLLDRQEKQEEEEADHLKSQDFEWREEKDVSGSMYTSSDLLLPPFFQVKWDLFVRAYMEASHHVQYKQAKLEEFNSLAKIVQDANISTTGTGNENGGGNVLSQKQIAKWVENVSKFLETLPSTSFLAQATRQLLKKELLLKQKSKEKKKMIELREGELEKLRKLQQEKEILKIPIGKQLEQEFILQHRGCPIAHLEQTPAEKIQKKMKRMSQIAIKQVKEISQQAQREFEIRTL